MAEGEIQHSRKKEEYKTEAQRIMNQQAQINEAEAQIIINQVKHQTQQEAQQYVGNVINYAEQAHLNKITAQKNKTEQADAKLNEQLKTQQTSNHNTTHRNEQTPDNRAKAKAKTGPSPKRNSGALPTVPPLPTGETSSGSEEKPKNNPESEHEPKGKPGRPSNVRTDNKTKPNPKHDTDKDDNRTRTHWRKAKRGYIMYKLSKHGWKWPKTSDGKMQNFHKKNWHKL